MRNRNRRKKSKHRYHHMILCRHGMMQWPRHFWNCGRMRRIVAVTSCNVIMEWCNASGTPYIATDYETMPIAIHAMPLWSETLPSNSLQWDGRFVQCRSHGLQCRSRGIQWRFAFQQREEKRNIAEVESGNTVEAEESALLYKKRPLWPKDQCNFGRNHSVKFGVAERGDGEISQLREL